MILRNINNRVLEKIPSIDSKDANTRAQSIEYINFSLSEVWRASNWEFRKKNAQFVLEPAYDTGTASTTTFDGTNENAARTVTLSVALPFDVKGRYFTPKNGSAYKIVTGNAGSLTLFLGAPVIDTDAVPAEFKIWRKFYYLRSDVDIVLDVRSLDGSGSLKYASSSKLSNSIGNLGDFGAPYTFSVYGIDPYDDVSYETGTVSITENGNTVTGTGTSFVGNVDAGDIFTVGGIRYTVKRVESNTQLILNNYVKNEIAAGSSYSSKKKDVLGLPFFYNADSYKVIEYEYLTRSYDLLNEDYDDLNLDRDYIDAIVLGAQAMWLDTKDYSKYIQTVNLYQAKLNGLKLKKRVVAPRYRQFEPLIDSSAPGRF